MQKLYTMVGVLILGACGTTHTYAQTDYGQGAGTKGPGHAFFGTDAGASNTDNGFDNSFLGHKSGFSNSNGVQNVFVGTQTGYSNLSGAQNVFIGAQAGFMSNGIANVFVGSNAGFKNTSGAYNTFLGGFSGQDNLTGTRNLFGGYTAGKLNTTGSFNTFLGMESGFQNTVGLENTFLGHYSGYSNLNGNLNVFLGAETGKSNVGGSSNTYVGFKADGLSHTQNSTAIGANAKVATDNSIVLGHKANVGIGTSAPAFQLHLSTFAAAKAGSPDWIVASDSRLKKNITDFTDGLDLLKQIRPIWFQYNGQAGIETGEKKFVGIVAQEMEKIAPYTIGRFTHQDSLGNKTEYLDYDANAVTYILINSVKEQQRVIEEKDARITALEKNQHELIARLEKLEQSRSLGTANFRKTGQDGDLPYLEQNAPNGFTGQTTIKYFVPSAAKEAVINIYNNSGGKVSTHKITECGAGELQLSAGSYGSGIHIYDLVVNGKVIGSRRMLIE